MRSFAFVTAHSLDRSFDRPVVATTTAMMSDDIGLLDDDSTTDDGLDSIWKDKFIKTWYDKDTNKFHWQCLHCQKILVGKNQPKAIAHLTGEKSRSASAKVSR